MDGVHGLAGWRWLFIFDGVITLPMALWGTFLYLAQGGQSVTNVH